MDCVWRYRGKANYRDAVFLAYGDYETSLESFARSLAVSGRFVFLTALAFVAAVNSSEDARTFLDDAKRFLRRPPSSDQSEGFIQALQL
jgi:hypothetical protein